MRIGTMKILWSLNSFIACVRTPNHIVRASADGSRTQCESIRNWTHLALHNNYNWCDNFALCETRKKVNRMVPSLPPPHLSFHSARSAWPAQKLHTCSFFSLHFGCLHSKPYLYVSLATYVTAECGERECELLPNAGPQPQVFNLRIIMRHKIKYWAKTKRRRPERSSSRKITHMRVESGLWFCMASARVLAHSPTKPNIYTFSPTHSLIQ